MTTPTLLKRFCCMASKIVVPHWRCCFGYVHTVLYCIVRSSRFPISMERKVSCGFIFFGLAKASNIVDSLYWVLMATND